MIHHLDPNRISHEQPSQFLLKACIHASFHTWLFGYIVSIPDNFDKYFFLKSQKQMFAGILRGSDPSSGKKSGAAGEAAPVAGNRTG
jgi:hypothetical protein